MCGNDGEWLVAMALFMAVLSGALVSLMIHIIFCGNRWRPRYYIPRVPDKSPPGPPPKPRK